MRGRATAIAGIVAAAVVLTACGESADQRAKARTPAPRPSLTSNVEHLAVCRTALDLTGTALGLIDEFGEANPGAVDRQRLDATIDDMKAVQQRMPAPLGNMYLGSLASPLLQIRLSAALGKRAAVSRTGYPEAALLFGAECQKWAAG